MTLRISMLAWLLLVSGCATLPPSVYSQPFYVGESVVDIEEPPAGWSADPTDDMTTQNGSITQYKMTYAEPSWGTYTVYVYVEDGKVTTIQDLGILPDTDY